MRLKRLPFFSALLITLLIVSMVAGPLTPTSYASANHQNSQTLNIGVIGPFDGPTAQGVALAIQRISALGPVTTPDGTAYTLALVTADANSAQEVAAAVDKLKQNNVVAIFGPDDDQMAFDSLQTLNAAGVPVFTGATRLSVGGGNLIFRTRAGDDWRMNALADYILTDLGKKSIAVYQGSDEVKDQVAELVGVLTKRGTPPVQTAIQTPGGATAESVPVLMQPNPEVVIAFGDSAQVAELYRQLRGGGFAGTFATPKVDSRTFIESVPEALRDGIYGVTTWPYSWATADSAAFLRDYVSLTGDVPTALSAAAYDSAVATVIAIKNGGIAPEALRNALLSFSQADSLQGVFNPKLGNNNLSQSVSVIVTNRYGAPNLVARYEGTERVPITIEPTPTTAAPTPLPSPTPDGVVGTMKSTVNVRMGPGTNYAVIGQLKKNEQIQLIGASADFAWYVVSFRQAQGWISASLVSVFGDVRTLPVVAAPPTPIPSPTPLATATPSLAPQANIVLVSASMNPPNPQPGQPMTLNAIIKNAGNIDAGPFAVATSFKPGDVYTSANVAGLKAGEQTTVALTNTVMGTGNVKVAIVLDLNNQVDEGQTGEADNQPEFAYKVDHAYLAQGTINIAPVNSVDFQGGTVDVSFDGNTLAPLNGALLGALSGTQLADVHYDLLTGSVVNNAAGIPTAQLTPGLVIGIYTAEGKRGVLRVSGFAGSTLVLDYFIYGP